MTYIVQIHIEGVIDNTIGKFQRKKKKLFCGVWECCERWNKEKTTKGWFNGLQVQFVLY